MADGQTGRALIAYLCVKMRIMKKTFLLLSLLFLGSQAKSQVWLELVGRGMYGLRGFYNQTIIDDRNHNYHLSTAPAFGGGLGLNLGDMHGINLEALWATNRQSFDFDDGNNTLLTNKIEWKTLEAVLLYRLYTGASYLEIGPKWVMLRGITQSLDEVPLADVAKSYAQAYPAAVLGVGGFLAGSSDFSLRIGLRVEYAFTDFVTESGKAANYPAPYVVPPYDALSSTNPFSASVYLEFNLPIGGIAKAGCGQRAFILGGR